MNKEKNIAWMSPELSVLDLEADGNLVTTSTTLQNLTSDDDDEQFFV